MSCPINSMSFAEGTLSRGCDKENGRSSLRPAGCGAMALLLCCSSSPMASIDSSSCLESETVSHATNGMLFMGQNTSSDYD